METYALLLKYKNLLHITQQQQNPLTLTDTHQQCLNLKNSMSSSPQPVHSPCLNLATDSIGILTLLVNSSQDNSLSDEKTPVINFS